MQASKTTGTTRAPQVGDVDPELRARHPNVSFRLESTDLGNEEAKSAMYARLTAEGSADALLSLLAEGTVGTDGVCEGVVHGFVGDEDMDVDCVISAPKRPGGLWAAQWNLRVDRF